MADNIEHEGAKVYIYTRVSTAIQVDAYALDAQKEEIMDYVRYQKMQVCGEYTDEGKSGKSIAGRDGFQQMVDDIVNRKDDISFVLVYKLSRFGRNAADVLNTLKTINYYGVHLICVEDNIDSSVDSGKLMISIMSAVAEIERENIAIQTMAGRREKARKGLFNGGVVPFGYSNNNGVLEIVESEAEIVRMIFDKYTHTEMGFPSIARWLNEMGYSKKKRCRNEVDFFTAPFIGKVIDNPTYIGKMPYGRTATVPKEDEHETFHRIKTDDYILSEGMHKAIISDDVWQSARIKRAETGGRKDKVEKEHEYILSGIVKCPICGKSLYGVSMRGRKRKDGTMYPTYYSYMCRPSISDEEKGHKCSYGQISCSRIDNAVRDIVMALTTAPEFQSKMSQLAGDAVDTVEVEKMIDSAIKDYRQALGRQRKIEAEMDALDVFDRHYDRKYESLSKRLEDAFDAMDDATKRKADAEAKLDSIKRQGLTRDSIYDVLKVFNKIYDRMTNKEKKKFMQSFIQDIELYPDKSRKNGCAVKTIHFRFPVSYNGEKIYEIQLSPPNENTVETVCLLSRTAG